MNKNSSGVQHHVKGCIKASYCDLYHSGSHHGSYYDLAFSIPPWYILFLTVLPFSLMFLLSSQSAAVHYTCFHTFHCVAAHHSFSPQPISVVSPLCPHHPVSHPSHSGMLAACQTTILLYIQ